MAFLSVAGPHTVRQLMPSTSPSLYPSTVCRGRKRIQRLENLQESLKPPLLSTEPQIPAQQKLLPQLSQLPATEQQ